MQSDLPQQKRFAGAVFTGQDRQFSRTKFKIYRTPDTAFIRLSKGKRELGDMSLLRFQIVLEIVFELENIFVDEKLRCLARPALVVCERCFYLGSSCRIAPIAIKLRRNACIFWIHSQISMQSVVCF